MTALSAHVGDKVQIKVKKSYEMPHLAEHAGKVGRVTRVGDDGRITIKTDPDRTGMTLTGVVRGRNSQGLRLTVGHNDLEHVKAGEK